MTAAAARELGTFCRLLRVLVLLVFVAALLFLFVICIGMVQVILHLPTPSYSPPTSAAFVPAPSSNSPPTAETRREEKREASIHGADVWVEACTRNDGVHVKGHWRRK
jgi:hypothetical protein